jgi:hypothetical protein
LNQKMAELGTQAPAAETVPAAPTTAETTTTVATPAAAPVAAAAPAAPVQVSKAERLQQLLSQYKADQITPQEYHEKRAAILAEP